MSKSKPKSVDVYAGIGPALGKTPNDPPVQSFLRSIGHWPLPELEEDEFDLNIEDEARGFSLAFEDGANLPPSIEAKPAGTLVLCGCFFYAEGADDYQQYGGPLPQGITWSDTPASLVAKLGPPKNEMRNKKTGELDAHRWALGEQRLLTASYNGDELENLYIGIY